MTAVEFLKEKLTSIFINDEGFNKIFDKAKEMEKQQIIHAAERWKGTDFAEKYYAETYVSKGSDELSKVAKNTSFDHIVDTNEIISSQIEILDEEILEESNYRFRHFEQSKKETWANACKWYREQLKSKQ